MGIGTQAQLTTSAQIAESFEPNAIVIFIFS